MHIGGIVFVTRGGRTIKAFDDIFFDWWSQKIPAIED
jgi:hypothetical protein